MNLLCWEEFGTTATFTVAFTRECFEGHPVSQKENNVTTWLTQRWAAVCSRTLFRFLPEAGRHIGSSASGKGSRQGKTQSEDKSSIEGCDRTCNVRSKSACANLAKGERVWTRPETNGRELRTGRGILSWFLIGFIFLLLLFWKGDSAPPRLAAPLPSVPLVPPLSCRDPSSPALSVSSFLHLRPALALPAPRPPRLRDWPG
jgi:hypothetical protein